jgi:galactose mutarotase-like enzyme
MKKLLLLILLLFITNLGYSKDIDLLCRGTLSYNANKISDTKKMDLNFSFNDERKTYTTDSRLMCLDKKNLKGVSRLFTEQNIIIENVTEDKNTTDNDYCFNTIELNRNSGLLKSTKMENTEGLIVIYTGNFNCELAKQKF